MEDSGLTDSGVEIGTEFGDLLKDWIEDWSDDGDSINGDWSENVNEGGDVNVSGIVLLYFMYCSLALIIYLGNF